VIPVGMAKMLAITIRQPWAWLIVNGHKDIENRSWGPGRALGQRIAIHAAARVDSRGYERARALGINVPDEHEIQRSAVIGVVDVTDVVTSSDSSWFVGPKGWVLRNPEQCEPIPAKGRLGLWRFDLE
jgi:hypothetical protein